MKDEGKATEKQQTEELDYFILTINICVVIIMLLCVFIYLVVENKLEIADDVCLKLNSFFKQAKLLLIIFLSGLWLIPIVYRNKTESRIYKITDLVRFIISMLAIPFYLVYAVLCIQQ